MLGGRQRSQTAPPTSCSDRSRTPTEADDVAIRVLDVEVHRAPRGRGQRSDDPCAVRSTPRVERLDAIDASRGVDMLLLATVLTLSIMLRRLLQVEFQPVDLTDRIEPVPGLTEGEAELLIVRDGPRQIVDRTAGRRMLLGRRSESAHGRVPFSGTAA